MNNNQLSDAQKKFITVLIGLILPIVALEFLLRILPASEGLHPLAVNANSKIMRFEENRDFTWSQGWNFSIISKKHTNNYGFLNDRDYNPHETTPLMAIIGDSYVAATQIENRLAMHGVLAKMVGDRGRVYSFGAPGIPLATYLMYAEYVADEFKPDSMVFIVVGNDFDESLSQYKRMPGAYHFFIVESGELALQRVDLEPNFVIKVLRQSALIMYLYDNLELYKLFNLVINNPAHNTDNISNPIDSDRVLVSKKAVDEFFRQLPLRSKLTTKDILFVIDGLRPQIYSEAEFQEAQDNYRNIMRKYFIRKAIENDYEVIDMQPIFINRHRQDGAKFEFETDGHWNILGHQLVANEIESSKVFSKTFNIR
jgi:hypothetical protein